MGSPQCFQPLFSKRSSDQNTSQLRFAPTHWSQLSVPFHGARNVSRELNLAKYKVLITSTTITSWSRLSGLFDLNQELLMACPMETQCSCVLLIYQLRTVSGLSTSYRKHVPLYSHLSNGISEYFPEVET